MKDVTYQVLMNDEEQYSLWPAGREVPAGWHPVGSSGSIDECRSYVEAHWTDMRPLSLRRALADTIDAH
ncbi:MbtH family NRPS accessory protein [Leifsonia shinshuensis]|uniref:MbtH family protein n=1 Tax=Leifsonia shinshuensis TaxID=150026 RepID=UPI001F50607D|nr:MbtH family NRPS accessory protein [Leifsonia shinshuensis]MCI0158113.1 MbtH family NRPS accessory protein [Leifsonia shinshuensis]